MSKKNKIVFKPVLLEIKVYNLIDLKQKALSVKERASFVSPKDLIVG